MIRKRYFYFLCVCFVSIISFADEINDKPIVLNEKHTKETLENFGICNVFISSVFNEKNNVTVSIEIENKSERDFLYLFGHSFEEDYMKSNYSIRFHKGFPKRWKKIIICEQAKQKPDGIIQLDPGRKETMNLGKMGRGDSIALIFPFYVARDEKQHFLFFQWKRRFIQEFKQIGFSVKIEEEEKTDNDFIRLSIARDSLFEQLSRVKFCKHPDHIESLELQEKPWKEKIENINDEIETIINEQKLWLDKFKAKHETYERLKVSLDTLRFFECNDCGIKEKHKPQHHCQFCRQGMTLEMIYRYLSNDILLEVRNVNNELNDVKNKMKDIKVIENCCKNSRHANTLKSNSEEREKINDCIERIKKYYKENEKLYKVSH